MSKEVYFVVYVTEDGKAIIDPERADACFGEDHVWDTDSNEWSDSYEHSHDYDKAHDKLQELLQVSWDN